MKTNGQSLFSQLQQNLARYPINNKNRIHIVNSMIISLQIYKHISCKGLAFGAVIRMDWASSVMTVLSPRDSGLMIRHSLEANLVTCSVKIRTYMYRTRLQNVLDLK